MATVSMAAVSSRHQLSSLSSPAFSPSSLSSSALSSSCLLFSSSSTISFHRVVCHSAAPSGGGGGGSCCGGSGKGAGSGSCSSHGKGASLANIGKEFEQMVASATLMEFEKQYDSKPMEGSITRDIIDTVMQTRPEGVDQEGEGEKFLDINAILEEASAMSNGGDFVFADDSDFVFV